LKNGETLPIISIKFGKPSNIKGVIVQSNAKFYELYNVLPGTDYSNTLGDYICTVRCSTSEEDQGTFVGDTSQPFLCSELKIKFVSLKGVCDCLILNQIVFSIYGKSQTLEMSNNFLNVTKKLEPSVETSSFPTSLPPVLKTVSIDDRTSIDQNGNVAFTHQNFILEQLSSFKSNLMKDLESLIDMKMNPFIIRLNRMENIISMLENKPKLTDNVT
jgi:hypothetical protein